MPKIKLESSGREQPVSVEYQVEGERFTVHVNGQSDQGHWVSMGSGEGWLNLDGNNQPFYITRERDSLQIWFEGNTYRLNLVSGNARSAGKSGASALQDGEVKAPMPGTVLKVLVQPGEIVEPDQPLIIMESMKMELTLTAPVRSEVADIRCQAGQLVEMGSLLAKLTSIEKQEG
jgi:3-methylcrotonyl-CoA carboxylase alpha subunit